MTEKNPNKGYVAILGWSLNAIDAIDRFDRRYVIVAPTWAEEYAKANDIPFIAWDFDRLNERSHEIAQILKDEGCDVAIPLFEETVEWAGAINAVLLEQPALLGQSMLFRDKSLMKRRAQLGGIRVGIFEEAARPRRRDPLPDAREPDAAQAGRRPERPDPFQGVRQGGTAWATG